jgi:pilus assembly protein TadC
MGFYDILGYLIGIGFVFMLILFFVAPFFIVGALMNDKTYNNVKAQIDDPPTLWESITKMK